MATTTSSAPPPSSEDAQSLMPEPTAPSTSAHERCLAEMKALVGRRVLVPFTCTIQRTPRIETSMGPLSRTDLLVTVGKRATRRIRGEYTDDHAPHMMHRKAGSDIPCLCEDSLREHILWSLGHFPAELVGEEVEPGPYDGVRVHMAPARGGALALLVDLMMGKAATGVTIFATTSGGAGTKLPESTSVIRLIRDDVVVGQTSEKRPPAVRMTVRGIEDTVCSLYLWCQVLREGWTIGRRKY